MSVLLFSLFLARIIVSSEEPSGHDSIEYTSAIALRQEGLSPVDDGSMRDTAPPATELTVKWSQNQMKTAENDNYYEEHGQRT